MFPTHTNQVAGHTVLAVCYPYSKTITCVCDVQGVVINCFPTKGGVDTEEELKTEGEEKYAGGEDNITEIILATTALVAVIAFFTGWVNFLIATVS